MPYIKRDINIKLLILVIVSVILFILLSVFYNNLFKNVSLECKNKLEQLSQTTEDLNLQREKLNETYRLITKVEGDKIYLDKKYNELRDENLEIKAENSNVKWELVSTRVELDNKMAELNATKNLLAQVQNELGNIKAEINSLRTKIYNLEEEKEYICDYIKSQELSHNKCLG